MKRQTNRRQFLKNTALVGVGVYTGTSLLSRPVRAANEEINFACVGVGGKGKSDSDDAARNGKIVAMCDIDDQQLDKAGKNNPDAERFNDFREMFDKMGDKIDAVTVSTPDHCHAVVTAMALKKKIACYTQKPLTHSIYEAHVLGELARENKVATQMGNQGTANNGLRRAAEIIQSGGLGKVHTVHVWTNRPIWPQGVDRPTDEQPVPEHIHWDLWLGPAPERPYHGVTYHPFRWRGWWDFGTGALGDMACHTVNMPFMALDLRNPTTIEAETSGHNKETYPSWSQIRYEFPANDKRGPITMIWYDGGKMPDAEVLQGQKPSKSGCVVVGEEGSLYSPDDYGAAFVLLPEEKFANFEGPMETIPRSPGHFVEWVNAIRGGDPAMSNFPGYAADLTKNILLGNLSVWAGKKIEWDAEKLEATNAPEVAHIIRPEYRMGYTL